MSLTLRASALLFSALFALAITGCPNRAEPPTDDHADHDHGAQGEPASLADAHHQLEEMAAEIKQAFEAGKPADADSSLHKIGHVIEDLVALGKKAGIDEKELASISDDLMGGFMKLDTAVHEKLDTKWSDVSEKIDAAMEKLEGLLPKGSHDDHGDGDDHDSE